MEKCRYLNLAGTIEWRDRVLHPRWGTLCQGNYRHNGDVILLIDKIEDRVGREWEYDEEGREEEGNA